MIAMALAGEPRVLIADEPTTALDVTIQAQILDLIDRLQQETGMATLFITHDLGVLARIAREVAIMYAGRIVERGPAADVLRSPWHPYTEGLLASLPSRAGGPAGRLRSIPGTVPDLGDLPPGLRLRAALPPPGRHLRPAGAPGGGEDPRAHGALLGGPVMATPAPAFADTLLAAEGAGRGTSASAAGETTGGSGRSTGWTSGSAGARRWGWWASRAAARPPWGACCWGSTPPTGAASTSTGGRSSPATGAQTRGSTGASRRSSRTPTRRSTRA